MDSDSSRYGQRPFAALGLGTRVFYTDRDAAEGKAEKMDAGLRKKIVERLGKLSDKYKDADTKAAFMLARGLVRDGTATEELVTIASSKSGDPVLRGFCCVALGLMGDARFVKDAEDRSTNARTPTCAATRRLPRPPARCRRRQAAPRHPAGAVLRGAGPLITAIGMIGDHTAIAPLVAISTTRRRTRRPAPWRPSVRHDRRPPRAVTLARLAELQLPRSS
jgi:hypothetical protein